MKLIKNKKGQEDMENMEHLFKILLWIFVAVILLGAVGYMFYRLVF